MSNLFSGTIYFAHVTFATPSQNFAVSAADMQTMTTYAQHAIVPISEWVPQYGPSTVAISPSSIEFTANMSSTSFTDSDLQGWVNSIVSSNGLDPTSTAIVVPCPAEISESAGEGIGPNSGYHFIANVPYAVWGMGGTNITLADEADVYAMVVSHEISELIVDPQGNLSTPEVCDPCCENCEGVQGSYSGGFFRAYFDIFNDYLGTNQQTPPGGFDFAYYNAVIVKPAGAEYSEASDCDATAADCNYAPVNQNFYFVIEQDDFGRDAVNDNPTFPLAFYLFLEGFSPNDVGTTTLPDFTGTFSNANIPSLSITHTGTTYDVGNTGANGNIPQRIRFEYQVAFTAASLAVFPLPGNPPKAFSLLATISVQGQNIPFNPQGEFFLLGGADPYFTNVNNTSGNQPYLSQDLRVFTGTPAVNDTPVAGGPTLSDSVGGAYSYITSLITHLNQTYGYLNPNYSPPDTNMSDPLDGLLPSQIATDGDSLVTQVSGSNNNYNFAIARVRLRGASTAAPAENVKVFFRLFTTQTFDTDFIDQNTPTTSADPNITYPSSGSPHPESPEPGTDGSGSINGCSLPFFATANLADNPSDYSSSSGINNQTIVMPPMHDYAWAFYGCFMNVWDNSNTYGGLPVQHWMPGSGHSCLVAQIAYDDAPIVNAGGIIETPESSDKLAQRNLQVNHSGNPVPATHRVPQTIDARPSPPPASTDPTNILSYPDEMMIDWGKTPIGSVANIYWPAVSASSVLQLAAQLYSGHMLTAADAHTIQCKVVSPVTYVPIPRGVGGSFAGLFTVDLPNGIRVGNEFDIIVRRITTRQVVVPPPPPPPPPIQRGKAAAAAPAIAINQPLIWRYITGSFLVKIEVQKESAILPVDENLLAVLKWRLGLIETGNRWYPVLLRWISVLSSRIVAMGGNPGKIPASPRGYQPPSTDHKPVRHGRCYTGKVAKLSYNCFGDFEGFNLNTCECETYSFSSCEPDMEELIYLAWVERFEITVCACKHDAHRVESVALLRAPRH